MNSNHIAKQTRLTLNKQIAAAPTRAQKWEIALHGGKPPTAIQQLPFQVIGLATPSPFGADWQTKAIEQAKKRFAELLFPALMKDDPRPFEELIQAMARRRKTTVSLDEFVRRKQLQQKMKPTKKEAGRKLRLAILNLKPDDLTSMPAALKFLDSRNVEYSDESHVRRVMREMDIHLLKPGDTVYFGFSKINLQTGAPEKWMCLRKLIVGKRGEAKNLGMSRKKYDDLLGMKAHSVSPTHATSPDK
jgi:hypothetical protein